MEAILDCGDNSCEFAEAKTGMRTNGGCSCLHGLDHEWRMKVRRYINRLRESSARLKADYQDACNAVAKLTNERDEARDEAKAVDLYRGHHVRLSEWMGDKDGEVWRSSSDLSDRVMRRTENAEAKLAWCVEALEMIAGERQCIDNLMGNVDIARAALAAAKGEE